MSDWKTVVDDWKVDGAIVAPPDGFTQDPDGNAGITDASGWEMPNTNGGGEGGGPTAAGGNRACFNCGQEGHTKADCTNARVLKCRHCNEEGHLIRDCPTAPPQEFTGECRFCHKEGHMAKDCPDKPPMVCKNCQQEGHPVAECKSARKIDRSHVAEVAAEIAWGKLAAAIKEKDMDSVKECVEGYLKAEPATTYIQLEEAFRAQGLNLYLIGLENTSVLSTHTHMDLQGNLDKKYRVHYRWSDKPLRPREAGGWPKSVEENKERLQDAGEVVDRGLPKCTNCDELGHIAKRCPQEKVEKERVTIMCYNCDQPGHRVRDCPEPRKNKYGCKNCGQGGHIAAECPEPRRASPDTECRKCNGTGHFAKDCPQGGGGACYNCGEQGHNSKECSNPKKVQCRNCDEYGHVSKECPKPRDYSRVKCSNCGEMGHTKVRCKKEPAPAEESGFDAGFDGGFDAANGGSGGNADPEPATEDWGKGNGGAGDGWEQTPASVW
ncbi:WD40 repeat-like protein [Hypoxylon texense]